MSTGHPYVKNEMFRETCPISIYDVAAVESWLEDLVRRGYRPIGFTGFKVELLPDEPRESRFRLQPLQRRKETLDPERVEAYRVMGWQLVGQLGPFWVWRCEDPKAPELDTDPVVQGEGYRYLKRRMLRRTVGYGLVWLALLGFDIWVAADVSLRAVLDGGSWLELIARPLVSLALMVMIGVEIWLDARNTRRLWRTLTAGVPLERPRPYRRQLWMGRIAYAAIMAVLALNLVVSFQDLDNSPSGWDHAEWTVYEEGERPPAQVILAELAALDGLDPEWTDVREKSLPIAPEMYAVRQLAYLPDVGQISCYTEYYRMLTEGLARDLTEELTGNRAGFLDREPELPLEPVSVPGTDGFWWAEENRTMAHDQFAVLRQGKQVLAIWYTGPTDLRTETAYLASLLPD